LPCGDLCQLDYAALYAAGQYGIRRPTDYWQPRPLLLLHDRVTFVDVNKRSSKTVSYKEVERYAIERTNSPLK